MNKEILKKTYSSKSIKFRRAWVNLFRDYSAKNRFQPSTIIVLFSFIITVILTLLGYTEYAFIPFLLGCCFILVSFIYFRFFPLTWKEMNDKEREAYKLFNRLPNDWDLEK